MEEARTKGWQAKAEEYFATARACEARVLLAQKECMRLQALAMNCVAKLDMTTPSEPQGSPANCTADPVNGFSDKPVRV